MAVRGVVGEAAEGAGEHLGQFEGVLRAALPDAELQHGRRGHVSGRVGHPRRLVGALVHQPQGPACESAEVHQQVEPLGRCGGQGRQFRVEVDRYRARQQSAVAADLVDDPRHRLVVLVDEDEFEDARVGGVDQPEPVPGRVDVGVRPDAAVDRGVRAGEGYGDRLARLRVALLDDHRLVQEPAVEAAVLVGVEVAVGDDERDLPLAGGQAEGVLLVVPDEVGAVQARHHVPPGDVHGVVVVPPLHRLVVVRVLGQLGVAMTDGVVRPAVVAAAGLCAVQVGHRPGGQGGDVLVRLDALAAGLGGGLRAAVRAQRHLHRGDRVLAVLRDPVGPGDAGALSPAHLDGRARHVSVVAPHQGRRQLRVQTHPGRAQGDLGLAQDVVRGGP